MNRAPTHKRARPVPVVALGGNCRDSPRKAGFQGVLELFGVVMQPLVLSTGGIKRPAEQPELRTDRSTTRCAVYQDTFVSTWMFNKMVPDIATPLRFKPGYAGQIRTMIAQDIAHPVRGVVERLKQDPQLIACLKRYCA